MLYIHFTRRWVKPGRRSSASREGEDEKNWKERRSLQRRALGFAGAASAIDAAGAGAGAVETVRNAVVLPTPGTEAWWRAAVREAVYAPLERPAQHVRETVN